MTTTATITTPTTPTTPVETVKPGEAGATTPTTTTGTATTTPAGEAQAAPTAPDKYVLTLPEQTNLDAADLADIEALAREANLPNDQAQALVEREHARQIAQSARLTAELTADKEYGGEKLAETQALARGIINRVRPEGHPRREAFQRILDRSGYGNHVEIASFLADLGRLAGEDTTFGGTNTAGGKKTAEQVLYGS